MQHRPRAAYSLFTDGRAAGRLRQQAVRLASIILPGLDSLNPGGGVTATIKAVVESGTICS